VQPGDRVISDERVLAAGEPESSQAATSSKSTAGHPAEMLRKSGRQHLLADRRGLIEVWEAPVGVGEGGLMLPDLAMDAVSKHENWWRYDPEENWDPGEDLTRYAGLAGASSRGR